jgi:hypothetical protein
MTIASVQTAVVYRLGGKSDWGPGVYMSFECMQFDGEVRLPLGGVVETLAQGIAVNSLELALKEKSWDYDAPRHGERFGPNLKIINTKIMTPFFVEFYEDNRLWLEAHALRQKESNIRGHFGPTLGSLHALYATASLMVADASIFAISLFSL